MRDDGEEGRDTVKKTKLDALCGKNIEQIADGHRHLLVLIDDGSVYSFGTNLEGQLGKFVVC